MTDTLIKVDLNQAATENEQIHNRWHPDIPMACWVKPGDDFILETYDWTAGAIKNNDDASDVRELQRELGVRIDDNVIVACDVTYQNGQDNDFYFEFVQVDGQWYLLFVVE